VVDFLTSLAMFATSAAVDIAVPTPGTVDATPEISSRPAPSKSPFLALSIANAVPKTKPTKGIFFATNFAVPFLTAPFATFLLPVLSNDLPKFFPFLLYFL
jgi:hypothetical protein